MTFKSDNAITKTTWRRGVAHQRGVSNTQAKLDEVTVKMLRASEVSTQLLAKRLGVSEDTVRRARDRKSWKHVA